jgi:hypothetical protein
MLRFSAWKAFGVVAFCAGLAAVTGCGSDESPPGDEPMGSVTWCEVSQVLEAKCQRCHVGEGLNGAPFPLVSYDDTQVLSASGDSRRWQHMQLMVDQGFMPPEDPRLDPPPAKLTEDERATLMTWFGEGAKAVGGTACP